MSRRVVTVGLVLLAAGLVVGVTAVARPAARPARQSPGLPPQTVVQGFPGERFDRNVPRPAEPFHEDNYPNTDTAWAVEWDITNPGNGPPGFSGSAPSSVLKIKSAHFRYKDKDGKPRWVTVLKDLELGEVFVPYDTGSPRYEDVETFGFWITKADPKLLGPPCVAPGEVLKCPDPLKTDKVFCEVHDDGVRWVADASFAGPDHGRRGQKLTLWAVFYGANYRYLIEYGFADDGTLSARLGATARNLLPRQPTQRDVHLHVGCWAFDPHLGDPTDPAAGGPDRNSVQLVRRVQQLPGIPDGRFRIDVSPFPAGPGASGPARPGAAMWVPEEFTALRVESTVRRNGNPDPQPTGYDLMTVRTGSCRNFPGPRFEYANRDFWVTAADPSFTEFRQVPEYVERSPGTLDGKPVRVWHNAAVLHVPRAEDFGPDGRSNANGLAIAAYAGFHLKPRNLFDKTPLFE
jgi:hypothetical protein